MSTPDGTALTIKERRRLYTSSMGIKRTSDLEALVSLFGRFKRHADIFKAVILDGDAHVESFSPEDGYLELHFDTGDTVKIDL